MRNRAISLTMAAMLLMAMLASCAEGTASDTNDTPTDTAAWESSETLDGRFAVDDELGSYDFEEYTFRIATCDGRTPHYFIEEAEGDVVNDAVYERNRTVEERFNCQIRVINDSGHRETALVTNSIAAGEDSVDLVCWHVMVLGGYAANDLFMNWYDVPAVNFEKPWWSDSNAEHLTHEGFCPMAIGDLSLSALANTYCVYYNKTRGEDYAIPDVYEVVNNGEWTFDWLVQTAKDIYQDLNGGNEADDDDWYGFVSDCQSNVCTYLWAFDNPIYTREKDELVFSMDIGKAADIAEKLLNSFEVNPGLRLGQPEVYNYGMKMFGEGKALFANGVIGASLGSLRDFEDDYAILPYPKWNDEQEEYYTSVDGSYQVMAVPVTVSDPERVGVITEALCAESYKRVVPAYYDVALKLKGARDEQSIEMLDKIVESRVFDFGFVYDNWKGAAFIMQELMKQRSADFASYWASAESAIMAHYEELIAYFENAGE